MATKEQMQEDTDSYGLAFDEPDMVQDEVSEDTAFGLTPDDEMPAGDAGDGSPVEVSIEVAPPADAEQATEAVMPEEEPVTEPAAEEPADTLDVEKERQRLKSWEGRLKAQQAEIDAKTSEAGEPESEESDETASEEAAEGEAPTIEQAIAALSQDFGDDFVSMIRAIARSEAMNAAGESIDEMGKTVEAIIGDMNDTKQRMHFETIFDAHPDFMETAESPEFIAWMSQNPEMKQVAISGSAKDVVKMLDAFVESTQQSEEAPMDVPPTDDAEGVRSTGLRIPAAPEQSGDFKDAWDQF